MIARRLINVLLPKEMDRGLGPVVRSSGRDHTRTRMKPRQEADIRPGISRRHRAELPGFREQVPVRCRHRYISRSWSRGSFRFFRDGITASAPRRPSSLTSQSASSALSPTTARRKAPRKLWHNGKVVRLAWQDHEAHGITQRVRKRDDFTGQATPGPADSLTPGSPWRAGGLLVRPDDGTVDEHVTRSGFSDKALKTPLKTPDFAQRRNLLHTLFHLPKLSGRSRQGAPTLSTFHT